MSDYNITDLLKSAHENQPANFKSAFQDLMQDKITNAIDAKRDVIAQEMMNGPSNEEDLDLDLDLDFESDSDEE
jgi:hypothetical protein